MSERDNTPVLIGIGKISQREEDPAQAVEALELMNRAARAALADCGQASISSYIDSVAVPQGMWGYTNPAAAIADALALTARSELYDIGILQQTLIGDACARIAGGEHRAVLVVGGEAKFRQLRASILGVEVPESQQDREPDAKYTPHAEIWSEVESAAGLGMPVGYYAIMESAYRAASGESIDGNRQALAELYAGFSQVAAANPDAWNRQPRDVEFLLGGTQANRMLAFPYAKYHNTQWNVDQSSALLFCSRSLAIELGIDPEKWVYPLVSSENNHMVNLSQRDAMHESPGARLAGKAALQHAELEPADLDYVELYSCFPAAVRIYARELGLAMAPVPTVTGGMTFGGGPLNNFVFQATVKMAELLRANPGKRGMVSCVSGMLTKQGFGIWSTDQSTSFANIDVTEAVKEGQREIALIPPAEGNALIAGATVIYSGDAPSRAIAVCDLPDGRRTVAFSEDAEAMTQLQQSECVGCAVRLFDDGRFALS